LPRKFKSQLTLGSSSGVVEDESLLLTTTTNSFWLNADTKGLHYGSGKVACKQWWHGIADLMGYVNN
jgi:hypothetical protein